MRTAQLHSPAAMPDVKPQSGRIGAEFGDIVLSGDLADFGHCRY